MSNRIDGKSLQSNRAMARTFGNLVLAATTFTGFTFTSFCAPALSLGVVAPQASVRVSVPVKTRTVSSTRAVKVRRREIPVSKVHNTHVAPAREVKVSKAKPHPVVAPARALQPQAFSDKMSSHEIAPGVVHKFFRGPLAINVLDIDLNRAPVKILPTLAGGSFNHVEGVEEHARDANALAAINANYFKRNGTPLGTLIIDGEWVSGPLYDRVSMGITRDGTVRIDRVSFGGVLTTDNPDVPKTWVNNINQPRRSGCHLFLYTRRWGAMVTAPYEACLVAVDAQGKVQDMGKKQMGVPWGGYVLFDSKDSPIANLHRGDSIQVEWQTKPYWDDVVEAVSGGPMLIKDGKLYLDLKDENFRKGWTGSQIRARTVTGVTADNHLLLATVEGPHTLWDIAKFLRHLGAVDAMNLDGGGSTTMVVDGHTVTRNSSGSQRRVASSIVVVDTRKMPALSGASGAAVYTRVPGSPPVETIAPAPAPIETDKTSMVPAVQVEGITTPPAQTVDVAPVPEVSDDRSSAHHKKKHHFGIF